MAYVLQTDGKMNFSVEALPTSASGSVSPAATLIPPTGMKLLTETTDSNGNIYLGGTMTSGGGEVAVYAPGSTGAATPTRVIAGSNTGILSPLSMVADASGQLYISDLIVGSTLIFAGDANGNVAPVRTINDDIGFGMALDAAGNFYLAGFPGNAGVAVFGPTANGNVMPTRIIQGSATNLTSITEIFVDSNNNLWASNLGGPIAVLEFAPTANGNVAPIRTITGAATTFANPEGIAVGSDGKIYVCDVAGFDHDTGPSIDIFAADASGNVAPLEQITSPQWTETLDAVFSLY